MKREDFVSPACSCPQCEQAGVTELEGRRDPWTGSVAHGYDLRRWYEARAKFRKAARAAVGGGGRHAQGFERLGQEK